METVWWSQITSANRFVNLVVGAMLDSKSVILILPENPPWYKEMQEMVEISVKKQNSRNSFDYIESPAGHVGEFLLHKYCKEEKWVEFRPGNSYAKFLAQSDDIVLNDTYVWVRNIPEDLYEEWIWFIAEYRKNMRKDAAPAVFVLEASDASLIHKAKKGITPVSYEKEITSYDAFTFCALAASQIICPDNMRPYLAELVSCICGQDVELCSVCVKRGKRFLENPKEVIDSITELRSDKSPFVLPTDEEAIGRKIWKTQIKVIFPLIEDYRSGFVNRYREVIKGCLPIKNSNGETVTDPTEVEIGTLYYMAVSGQIRVRKKDQEQLGQFREARNTLAHLKILAVEEIENILASESY